MYAPSLAIIVMPRYIDEDSEGDELTTMVLRLWCRGAQSGDLI
jgi:hypothetical protein